MINAIIEREGKGTVIIELNQTGGKIYDELRCAGIEKSIKQGRIMNARILTNSLFTIASNCANCSGNGWTVRR